MKAFRHQNTNTTANCQNLITTLQHDCTKRVILFVTPASDQHHSYTNESGPATNLPLVAALAEIEVPNLPRLYLVFDGNFLNAARRPRFHEVRDLLDTAQVRPNTYFCPAPVQFTAELPPEEAAEILVNAAGQVIPFDANSRPDYFALLVPTMNEQQYEATTRG